MTTTMPATGNAGSSEAVHEKNSPPRQLWQALVFVVGVVTLVAAVASRLPGRFSPSRQFEGNLTTVRAALEQPGSDLQAALVAAQRALEAAKDDQLGECNFLLGSVHLFLAGTSKGETAANHYATARKHLEEAERLGVAEGDINKLVYRLGQVGHFTDDDPHRVAHRLQSAIEAADSKAEGYSLLCQAYLKQPKPDLAAALKANEQLRQLPMVDEDVLAGARLQAGELLLKLGKPEEARKVLEKVGPRSPAAVLSRARRLRARSFEDETRWNDAAGLWQAALQDSHESPAEQAILRYHLGLCLSKTDQVPEAIRAWSDCQRDSKGDEGQAAALALAEIYLGDGSAAKALEPLGVAVRGINTPDGWKNSLADLARARQVFEKVIQTYRQARQVTWAIQAAENYERIALPGRAQVLRGEAAAEGARDLQEQAKQAAAGDKSKLEASARELYRQSAEAYTKAAAAQPRPGESAHFLWLAAARALDGQDHAQVAVLLERFLPINKKPERMGEGWYLLAETRARLKKEPAALDAYRECIKHPTPFAYRARYQLALIAVKNGELDEAEAALELNLKLLRFDPDSEAQEKSLFALGGLLYQRKNYSAVVRKLEEALGRFPANAEATRAHYQLAESYYILANQENQRILLGEYKNDEAKDHGRRQCRRLFQRAAEEYLELNRFLETPEAAGHLSADEAAQVPFLAAECKFNLGQYEDALTIYEKLAAKSKDLDRLNALGGMVRCLSSLGRADKVRERLADIRASLANMDDTVKAQWENWLRIASKPFEKQ